MKRQALMIVAPAMALLSVAVTHAQVEVETFTKKDPICSDVGDPNIDEPLSVCNVLVHLDAPATRLLSVGSADVNTDAPDGFYHHPLGGNTAPLCTFIPAFPSLVCDSFTTIGVKCSSGSDNTGNDCAFDPAQFNFGGHLTGGWLSTNPDQNQGLPDADGNVLVAQLAVTAGSNIGGSFIAYVEGAFGNPIGSCPDLTGDLLVNVSDLILVLANCGPCAGCPEDFNSDGVVDAFDIAYLLHQWGVCGDTVLDFAEFELSFECFAPPGASNCCEPRRTPGCDCQACQDIVCGADPFCCEVEWDRTCAAGAAGNCDDLCGGGDFDCGGGDPICGDGICDDPESCANCPQDCGGPCEVLQDFLTTCLGPEGTFVQFGNPEIPPIPADFFGPGSDPFVGIVGFEGTGEVDTIIERQGDPFQPADPPGGPQGVQIQIIQLSLTSADPITVTFNGGQNPEEWAVDLDLSVIPSPPGGLNAFKTHDNGGFFESLLPVQPKFTFTKVDDPDEIRVLDTGNEGIPPVQLQTGGAPWVHQDDPNLNLITDPASDFVVGVEELNPGDPNSQVITPIIFQSQKGAVRHTVCPAQDVPECGGDADCDDGNDCTADLCLGGSCQNKPESAGTACGDAGDTDCTDPDTCDGEGSCDDNHAPSGTACASDGQRCTTDLCQEGTCSNIVDEVCFGLEAPKHDDFAIPCASCEVCPEPSDLTGLMDPVYLFSGEFYESVVDLRIRGRGIDFVWARKYRSKIGPNTLQGNGWDYSYNIRLEPLGPHLKVFNGTSRTDTYLLQGDGTWTREEFFRVIEQNDDTSYTLTFPDTGTWNFHPLDGSPQQGKVSSVTDRNGNTTGFDYDGLGRLIIIHDPLDTPAHNRDISIGYNADGFIASVTDFAGRSVSYEYYQNGDAGGSFGDLKSVTTPIVVNVPEFPIPAGHNYPAGKTTVYTYSKDFADERLNHNLLTITDPKGQTYLINEYAPTQDENDLEFDRIVRQTWGDPGDIINLVYVPQTPEESNNFATIKVILNDRVGNVKEFSYDAGNRGVIAREYTGRADPDLPTTEVDNRPMDQLRPDDPPFFETRYEYNQDSLRTRIVHPNLNEEIFIYDVDNPDRRSQGNLLQHCWLPGPLLGDQVQICESFEYDDGFGGCCGTNFVTRHVDGRGNETLHEYDELGNRTHTTHRIPSILEDMEYNEFGQKTAHILPDNGSGQRRRDEYTYYDSGPQLGYLHEEIVDAPNLALTTTYQYNRVGQMTRTIDPRGYDTLYIVNQLDQIVRRISREVTEGGGVRYERDTFYDPNDNVVRVDVQNKDDAGVLQANTHFTEIQEYEILNKVTRMCRENGSYGGAIPGTQQVPLCGGLPEAEFITTEYEYDANRNGTLTRHGEATNGNQPANTLRTLYDERDRVFREIRADGDADQSTTQYDYDGNRNPKRKSQGLEDVGGERITNYSYDGYDRLVASVDPMGNTTEFHYDANHNRVSNRGEGELIDLPDGVDNVRLSETAYVYDAIDRLVRKEIEFFDTDSGDPIDDAQSITETEWSDNSQITRSINDNNHETLTTYDTVNRRNVLTDQLSNTTTYIYDANSNVNGRTELEKSDLGNPDEEFTTSHTYDGLDRLTSITDNVGNTHTFEYDSRDNRTVVLDRLGNETRFVYDGINRPTKTVRDMNNDGANAAAVPGDGGPDIVTSQGWDDTSRLVGQTDDSDNTTSYSYDALDRLVSETYQDQTVHGYTYEVHDNKLTMLDANGSLADCTYDLLNRLTHKDITPGPGVSDDVTFENYSYDGLSRLVTIEDDDSLVTRSHDSLSNVTSETLNGQTTTCLFDGVGNELTTTYPGGRIIECIYDELERKKIINDVGAGVTLATYDYVGPGRVERREYGNGMRTDYTYDGITGIPNPPDDFGVKRIIGMSHTRIGDGSIIDDRTFTWDKMYNKLQRKDVRIGGPELTHDYTYDDIYRLTHTTVTDSGGGTVRDTNYDLDGVGNRLEVMGSPNPGLYTMDDTTPEPADRQMNQYTTTPIEARLYNKNGNLIERTGLATIEYDYRNQMVEYVDVGLGQRHTYAYDAFGRRIARVIDADGAADQTRYFYDGWQVCEEQNAASATQATYVYGLYIDEVLNMQRSTNSILPGFADFYYHTDDLYNVMALTDGAGDVVERHEYGDYSNPEAVGAGSCNQECPFDVNGDGQVGPFDLANLLACWGPVAGGVCQCLDIDNSGNINPFDLASLLASWGPCAAPTGTGNPYLFTGRRFDTETGWYYYRTRYLDPVAGRFTARDTIGMWGDTANLGNAYAYVGNRPTDTLDPMGLDAPGCDGIPDCLETLCMLECCAAHDRCYHVNGCGASSWFYLWGKCKGCNTRVVACIAQCKSGKRRATRRRPDCYCRTCGFYNARWRGGQWRC